MGPYQTPISNPSPPEFPAWMQNVSSTISLLNLKGIVDSDLLKQYLNIKEESDFPTGEMPLSGGNISTETVSLPDIGED